MTFDLEAELRDYAARRAITDAIHRYMRGLDRLDAALQRSAFHDDAYVDCGLMRGSADDFVAFAQGFLSDMEASQHLLGQLQINIHNSTQASGECYFQAWHGMHDAQGKPRDLFMAGRYVDEYSFKNGAWRISRRKLITDWIKDDPADHSFYAANPEVNRAGRRGEDFSEKRNWPM